MTRELLNVALVALVCQATFAQSFPTEEATEPESVVSPGLLLPGSPEGGAFLYPMTLQVGAEVLLFTQGGLFHTFGPPGTCLGDKIDLFSTPLTFQGLREPFQYEGAISPCECFDESCPDEDKRFYELGSVFESPAGNAYFLVAGVGTPNTVFAEGHFKELILARSADGRNWDFLDGVNPIVRSSTVCDPTCRFISLLQPEVVPGPGYWWGFFSWGYAEPDAFPDKIGTIRIYPDSPSEGAYRVQIRSGGVFRDLMPDGSFDFTPDTVAFDGIGSQIVENEQGELVVLQGELRSEADAPGGCQSDGFPTLGSGLKYRNFEEISFSAGEMLTSRFRPMPSNNITGFGAYTVVKDDNDNVVMLSTTSDGICGSDPSWPPGGNTFVGLEIVSSTLVSPDVLVRDTFGAFSPGREPGDLLAGTETEIGGLPWTGAGFPVFGDNVVTGETMGPLVGRVNMGGVLELDEITVSALVGQDDNFAALGFFADSLASLSTPGSVAVVIKPALEVAEVWGNGSANVILQISNFPVAPSVPSRLELKLDTTTNRLSASIDGVLIVDRFDLDTLGVQPSGEIAGFHLNGATANASTVDFLEIRQNEAPIFSDGFETGDTLRWDESSP